MTGVTENQKKNLRRMAGGQFARCRFARCRFDPNSAGTLGVPAVPACQWGGSFFKGFCLTDGHTNTLRLCLPFKQIIRDDYQTRGGSNL